MISKAIGVALVSAILSALLDGLGFKSRRLFSTLSAIIVMVGLVSSVSELLESVMKIACDTEIAEAADKATRAVGLGYVFGFTSDICNSLGESKDVSKTHGTSGLISRLGNFRVTGNLHNRFQKLGNRAYKPNHNNDSRKR